MEKLQIIGARAGRLLPWVIAQAGKWRRAGKRVLLLVPEQYTLQAERELVKGLKLPGLMDLDVLSPRRLRERIRERGGSSPLRPLDEQGRLMAISQSLRTCRKELQYYARVADQPGLPEKISVLMADMQKAGMTPQLLRVHAQAQRPATAMKETDLALIWETYEQLIAGRFADETMQQRDMIARVRGSYVMQDAAVLVYGFDVLQLPMCDLLCEAMPVCASITVTMVMDAKEAPDGRVFLTQRRSVHDLIERLDAHELPWEMRYLPRAATDECASALRFLEEKLFARSREVFTGDASAFRVHAAANPYAEAAYAAQTLRRWHDEGIAWQRMAVALADGEALSGIMAVTLQASGIPAYVVRKDVAARHGLCRCLIGSVRAAAEGYAARDVLMAARSGFTLLTSEEAMRLENYAIENNITRGKWLRPLTRGATAEAMEPLRQRLIAPMDALHDRLRAAKNAAASVEAVFRYLEETQAYPGLMAREEMLLAQGLYAEASQNRQVWRVVMDLLDQLHAMLGEERASMKDIAGLMEAGLTGAGISALPPEPDTVTVGEAGHLMTGEIDALILMGMQDGVTANALESLISEEERQALSELTKRSVGLTTKEQNALRQSDFYRTIALPRRYLLITCSQSAQDGSALRPAGLVADAQALLGVSASGGATADGGGEPPLSPLTALEGLALHLRALKDGQEADMDAAWQDALRWLWQSPVWHERTRTMLESLNARVSAGALTGTQTRRIFTQDAVSISRLEDFAACPYRHFVNYGLKPVPRRDFTFAPDEKGEFFHRALQEYVNLACARDGWPDIADEEIDAMLDQVLSPLTEEWASGPLREDAVGRQIGEGYLRSVRRTAWMFTNHARNSRFTTMGTEIRFGAEGGLPPLVLKLRDGRCVALRGVIDRIDRYEGDQGLYLRVVDYKSSNQALEPVRMWYGLQLQLLLYLKAASQGVEGALPAGAFYFQVQDPLVSTPSDIKQEAERLIAGDMHLRGVVLAESEVIEAMDFHEPGYSIGKVFNKDGSVAKGANAFDLRGMRGLLSHAQRRAEELADQMRGGCIDISPAQIDRWTACEGCDYRGLCGRDSSLPGGEARVLDCADKQELLARMANEMNGTPDAPPPAEGDEQLKSIENGEKGLHQGEK